MRGSWIFSLVGILMESKLIFSSLLEQREVICTSDKVIVNLAFRNPFDGVVFVEDSYTESQCRWAGTGARYLLVVVPLENATSIAALGQQSRNGVCGITYNPERIEHSLTLVISPDPVVITDEAFALTVRCLHSPTDLLLTLAAPSMDPIKTTNLESVTVLGSGGSPPQLEMQIVNGHGLFGESVTEANVGRRLSLDVQLKDTHIYDMFVHNCIAHDGINASSTYINIIDANGCAVPTPRAIDAPVFVSTPQLNATKHVYIYTYGFQFTSSNTVHFECEVTLCVSACSEQQCSDGKPKDMHNGIVLPAVKIQKVLNMLPQSSAP